MKRTPHYLLPFFQSGDLYRASLDLERMVVTDNQLEEISRIVGDGVLEGWNVCHSGADEIQVSPGIGLINGIIHKTLSIKKKTVIDNVQTAVYMQSRMMTVSGGLNMETESPASNLVSAAFSDTVAPATPTGLAATAVDFNIINLVWDANSETDFDHYVIERALISGGPYTVIGTPSSNGTSPSDPFQDVGLSASTTYYYRISAIDRSGNQSVPSSEVSSTTLPDTRKPSEASNLLVFPGNTMMSIVWDSSPTTGVVYKLTKQVLNPDGSVSSSTSYDNLTALMYQLTGLTNGQRIRVLLQTKSVSGVLSNGIAAETTPVSSAAPLDVLIDPLTAVVPQVHAIKLLWSSNPAAPPGSALGQKSEYRVRVIKGGVESAPIKNLGLALTKTVGSYNDAAVTGEGQVRLIEDDVTYVFRITTLDVFGNESPGVYVKGTTIDVTAPADPRSLVLTPGDETITTTWRHSSSHDVVGYNVAIAVGNNPYGPDIEIGYLTKYVFSGLVNDTQYRVRVRTRDDAATPNLSAGISSIATPVADTTAPAVPVSLAATQQDGESTITWRANTEPDFDHYVLKRMAVTGTLEAVPGLDLIEATELPKAIARGSITTVISPTVFISDDLVGLADFTGTVLIITSGDANGAKADVIACTVILGQITISTPLNFADGDSFEIHLTHPSLGTLERNVADNNRIFDIGLLNGQVYAYFVKAIDAKGNESSYSPPVLVSPNCGLNDLNPPTNLAAAVGSGTITLIWDQIVPTSDHPASDHTAFNIYRSTSPFAAFVLVDSVSPTVLTYQDSNLVNGVTYYYLVTAVRDNADVVTDTGSIQPANSIHLANVKITLSTPLGCNIDEIQNSQRLIARLSATIGEETARRLLTHRHLVRPLNSTTVTAVSLLSLFDMSRFSEVSFDGIALSNQATAYYENIQFDPGTIVVKDGTRQGVPTVYDAGTVYALSPSNIVGNVPFVGDFQVLVNGSVPTVPFSIDELRNVVVFPTPLGADDVVILDGTGLSYYVPAVIDLGNRGFDVNVNGNSSSPSIDEQGQTLRFLTALESSDVVSVEIEPLVPEFGNQQGARQVNLGTSIVLSDFTTQNRIIYVSTSGSFSVGDNFFAMVNGTRTKLPHVIDASQKTITFDAELEPEDVVSLEILGREEVQGLLPERRIESVDGSQFVSGKFLKAQLPGISHNGRVKERALPVFHPLTTSDKYVYQADAGILGTATTPYSIRRAIDGTLLLGTSGGLLKSQNYDSFLSEGEDSQSVVDYSVTPPAGLKFYSDFPDQIADNAAIAKTASGRFNGLVSIIELVMGTPEKTGQVMGASLTTLADNRILIAGGYVFDEAQSTWINNLACWTFDQSLGYATQVGDFNGPRAYHCAILLPSGEVLATGGEKHNILASDPITSVPVSEEWIHLNTAEIYDPVLETWSSTTGLMGTPRDFHSTTLISNTEVLIAGGSTPSHSYDGLANPPVSVKPTVLETCELYDIGSQSFAPTGSMNRARQGQEARLDTGLVVVVGGGQDGRELYSRSDESWALEGAQDETEKGTIDNEFGLSSIDSPVKQVFADSLSRTYCVSRNNVYATDDLETFVKMKGLEAVGVVHRIAEGSNGTLYAATDLGIYEITSTIRTQMTWFQGGLIGAGTTETFDLQPYGALMLAGTEIGIFSTSDDGDTWTTVNGSIEDVRNIEAIGSIIFASSGQDLYRSDDGVSWTRVAVLEFVDENSRMLSRSPFDLLFATKEGLYASRDGVSFFLVDFDENRDSTRNNVHMLELIGSDIIVGFDNSILSVGPALEVTQLSSFTGTIPTVTINGAEIRDGFRYDTKKSQAIFENKRFANDEIEATSNYGLFVMENESWYEHAADAAIIVYKNGEIQDDSTLSFNPRLGQISFTKDLRKTDIVTASIAGTSLLDEGEFFHEELEDKFEQEKGLPLSLGRDYAANILQMGLSTEHNFWERGLERNQYYCSIGTEVDRSFTSFLANAEFYIMGRRDFDRFNSTIDYSIESEQGDIGVSALVPLSALEVGTSLWVGTESGIFVLDPLASFSITDTIFIGTDDNDIRDMQYFSGDIMLVTSNGLFKTEDAGSSFTKNRGDGLPSEMFVLRSIAGIIMIGTDNAIYYSDDADNDYGLWFRANFTELGSPEEIVVDGTCRAMTVGEGIACAAIGQDIFVSTDGKTWEKIFSFDEDIEINVMSSFAKRIYVGTNFGIYSDEGSARSDKPHFRLENIESTDEASEAFAVNDMFVFNDGTVVSLYAVGNSENIYRLTGEAWTKTTIPEVAAIHRYIIINSGRQIAFSNGDVFVQ